jgi:nucleotide-binding universal stress UspA family protein
LKRPYTILVALDQSQHAKRALKTAIWLAKSTGARLIAVHVVPPPPPSEGIAPTTLEKLEKAYISTGSKILADLAWEASTKYSFKIDPLLETGDAREKIVKAARENNADMIVMGSRGMGKMKGLFLGSVSQSIMQSADIPVLIVK